MKDWKEEFNVTMTDVVIDKNGDWDIDELKKFIQQLLDEQKEDIVKGLPKEKDWLWFAYKDTTDEERILNHDEYLKLEKEEGWLWSGHTIQSGYNQCLSEVLESIKKV